MLDFIIEADSEGSTSEGEPLLEQARLKFEYCKCKTTNDFTLDFANLVTQNAPQSNCHKN